MKLGVVILINVAIGFISTTNWMSFLKDNVSLSDIFIPGSHDSGTYVLSKRIQPEPLSDFLDRLLDICCRILKKFGIPIWKVITPWAMTQTQSIFTQAQSSGIRYFDIRAGWNGTNWNMFHMEEGDPVSFALYDIKQFLNLYPKEIIIAEITHYFGIPSNNRAHEQLKAMIMGILGEYLYPCASPSRLCPLPTIGSMRQKNRRVLVVFTDYFNTSYFAHNPYIWAPIIIVNTYANSDNLEEMIAYNQNETEYYSKNKNSVLLNKLFKLSWTLTPQPLTIVRGFLPNMPNSILDITLPAISPFQTWANKLREKPSNILIFDYVSRYQIFPYILKWNNLTIR